MRVGVMVGSDKERSRADRLAGLIADGAAAESAGFTSFWMPQVPGYLDAMTAVALIGQATERIEIGTAVVPDPDPPSDDHGAAGADHPGRVRRAVHARYRAVAPLDRRWSTRSVLRSPGAVDARLSRRAARGVRRTGHCRCRQRAATGCTRRWTSRTRSRCRCLLSALGPAMLRLAGERTGGTILWMADERAIGDHVVPRITAAAEPGRPAGAADRRRCSRRAVLEQRDGRRSRLRQ